MAKYVARNIMPDLNGRPIYVVEPHDDGMVTSAMTGHHPGLYAPNLDIALQPELEASGEWRGPGVCVLVNVKACRVSSYYRHGFNDCDVERTIIGVVLHELVHWVDRPERTTEPAQEVAYNGFVDTSENSARRLPALMEKAGLSHLPPALLAHCDTFQRLACHVHYRASHGGGFMLQPRDLAFGPDYKGLEFLPGPIEFINSLHDEVRGLAHLPLREVTATEQPAAFVKLWDSVLARFVKKPALA